VRPLIEVGRSRLVVDTSRKQEFTPSRRSRRKNDRHGPGSHEVTVSPSLQARKFTMGWHPFVESGIMSGRLAL
jgi:hypothetical protein